MSDKFTTEIVRYILKEEGFELIDNEYINSSTKLTLKDNEGYFYSTNLANFNTGYRPTKFNKYNPHTIQNIKLWLKLNDISYKLISTEFINSHSKLIFKDLEGYLYSISLNNIQNNNHNHCKFHINNEYTIQNIKLWTNLTNKNYSLLSNKYISAIDNLKWRCLKEECGEIFESSWDKIKQGRGCGFCDGKQVALSNCLATKNPKLASEWHPLRNGELTPYDVTCGSGKEAWWQCDKNPKHEWEAVIGIRNLHDSECPYCSGRLATEENNLLILNPELCKEWNYNKNDKSPSEYTQYSNIKVWWKCQKCGHEWDAVISSRKNSGCPQCNEPKGEKRIREYLEFNNFKFVRQYTFTDLTSNFGNKLRFDFCILNVNNSVIPIEFDGDFHFRKVYSDDGFEITKYHDELKNKYCISRNISLIRIPFWEFDNIETILNDILINNNLNNKFIINNSDILN